LIGALTSYFYYVFINILLHGIQTGIGLLTITSPVIKLVCLTVIIPQPAMPLGPSISLNVPYNSHTDRPNKVKSNLNTILLLIVWG